MGQAKQRGTFEERQKAAYDREDALVTKRAENLTKLEELETASDERRNAVLKYYAERSLDAMQRKTPLMAANFSLIEGFGKVSLPLAQAAQ